jgi:hypothetical protein
VYSVKCGAGFFDLAKIGELAIETEIGGCNVLLMDLQV